MSHIKAIFRHLCASIKLYLGKSTIIWTNEFKREKSVLLMKLRTEEKFAFLQLAQYIARLDGEYSVKEREIICEYCIEMGIEEVEFEEEDFTLEENLEIFSSIRSQRIVLLALMILVHIDDKFGLYEHKTLDKIAQHFEVGEKDLHLFSMWGKAGSALFEQALVFIDEAF